MKARQYTEIKPLQEAPAGPYVDQGDREEALSDALRGVELGAYDEMTKGRFVYHLDLEAELQRRAQGYRNDGQAG